jgi:ATP-binding cassette, subfamily B, bacterial MsbA
MKTYFRLLAFAKPIEKYAIPYSIFSLLSILFSTLNLALLVPLLTILFNQEAIHSIPVKPGHYYDIFKTFNYYSAWLNSQYGLLRTLEFVCATIVVSVLLSNIFRYLAERVMENLRIHTLKNIREAVFNNIMTLHLGYFNNERKGNIISKVASDVYVVQYSVTSTLQVVFKEPLTLITYLAMLFIISYKLTLVTMLVIPLSALIIARIVKKLKKQAAESHITHGIMISYLDEALIGIRVVKAFNAVRFISDRFHGENEKLSKISRSMARRQQLASPVSEFLGILMVAAIVLYGGSLVLSGKGDLTGASFIAYIALFSQVMRPAKAISDSFANIHTGVAAGERVLSLVDEKPLITDPPGALVIDHFQEAIRFDQVSFAYSDSTILDNISFSIPKGETIALVGPSGGGKSTLMDLIPKFIQPKSGVISIDGTDIQQVNSVSLRSLMGVVNQDPILFNDTIYNNIAFGRPHANREEVETAARIANAHDFISATEKGYETNIGDKGVRLSGGQRQRICIARAVLNNPPIMLLDEATSALDTESEKLVQDALTNLMKNRTSLIIAHRLSTIQNADNIIVLDGGKIVEQGSHSVLLLKNGLYKRLIDMQTFV